MTIGQAVSARIDELCRARDITVYALAKLGGINRNTLYQIRDCNTVKLDTINDVCDTFGISLSEFFNSSLFNSGNFD